MHCSRDIGPETFCDLDDHDSVFQLSPGTTVGRDSELSHSPALYLEMRTGVDMCRRSCLALKVVARLGILHRPLLRAIPQAKDLHKWRKHWRWELEAEPLATPLDLFLLLNSRFILLLSALDHWFMRSQRSYKRVLSLGHLSAI